ncbi:kinase D-interacting substrate of 220 kDa-like isoform X4 [Acropora millepora]|nr:kinase D-interacting substrate of 220 kDa-like isoform X4 [Acropora millepora]XP_029195262.2 kinase D-interacting substrate of 220 kDa-like isoform X4 [Acropora millepora]XP_044177375.1 kinase D-interacting substrate of 220 kDa-like isoform X4 [Acropora millepora]XP_044177376.1 kinase D-interacting substrate of 220 kDa-like isoform X4 [Acropora millepora]
MTVNDGGFLNAVRDGSCTHVLNLLENGGIDLEQRDQNGQTSLIIAAEKGNLEIVHELIKRNVQLNVQDEDGWTALIAACKEGHHEIAKELLEGGAKVQLPDLGGWSPLVWASYKGHAEIVRELLNYGADPNERGQHGMTALIWASGRGHTEVVDHLLEAGANPDAADKYGTTALVWSCRKGHLGAIKSLLLKNANVNTASSRGWTPLIMAAKGGYTEVVDILLEREPHINATDQEGNSALAWSAKHGHEDIVQRLLARGAYFNLPDREGETVLISAARDGHLEVVRTLLSKYADIEASDCDRKTALFHAVEKGHVLIVKELLDAGANTETANKDGETPLLRATQKKHTAIVSLLLEKGASVSVADKRGDTAVHIAVRGRYRRICELLLKNPKDARLLYRPNKSGETPYNIDRQHKHSLLTQIFGTGLFTPGKKCSEEVMGYEVYTSALADVLCEPSLNMPLTVGMYARWGSGKSFVLRRLQEEMREFAHQDLRAMFHFSRFVFIILLVFCTVVGVVLAASVGYATGIGIALGIFLACYLLFVIAYFADRRYSRGEPSCGIGAYVTNAVETVKLLCQLVFCIPPSPGSTKPNMPVRFLFTDFSKLTCTGSEAASLVGMIETLCDVVENEFGFFVTRLYRVFRSPPAEYDETMMSEARWKRCCCCVPTFIIFLVILALGLIGLVFYKVYGTKGSSAITGIEIAAASIVGVAVLVHLPTLCSILYSLVFSQKKRISVVATQLGLKEEGFIHALKQEVELITDLVNCVDGFTKHQTRVVIVIDGLDNSEQSKVLQLLDSVNLLFTDPEAPFIILMAVDPRVIIRAIDQSFSSILRESHISASDYLKSIVQLPFYLPEPRTNYTGVLPPGVVTLLEDVTGVVHTGSAVQPERESVLADELEWDGEILDYNDHNSLLNRAPRATYNCNGGVINSRVHPDLELQQSMLYAHSREDEEQCLDHHKLLDHELELEERRRISTDLVQVLADNETVNPLGVKRLMNIISLTCRLLRARGIDYSWKRLAAWVSVVDGWPYKTSWLVLLIEDSNTRLQENVALKDLHEATLSAMPVINEVDCAVDGDPVYFETFLASHYPLLSAADVRRFLPCTVHLDPSLRRQMVECLQSVSSVSGNKSDTGSLGKGSPHLQVSTVVNSSKKANLATLTVEDVCKQIAELEGLDQKQISTYQTIITENNINGIVLSTCDLGELGQIMAMTFGDWQLFRAWILTARNPGQDCTMCNGRCLSPGEMNSQRIKTPSGAPDHTNPLTVPGESDGDSAGQPHVESPLLKAPDIVLEPPSAPESEEEDNKGETVDTAEIELEREETTLKEDATLQTDENFKEEEEHGEAASGLIKIDKDSILISIEDDVNLPLQPEIPIGFDKNGDGDHGDQGFPVPSPHGNDLITFSEGEGRRNGSNLEQDVLIAQPPDSVPQEDMQTNSLPKLECSCERFQHVDTMESGRERKSSSNSLLFDSDDSADVDRPTAIVLTRNRNGPMKSAVAVKRSNSASVGGIGFSNDRSGLSLPQLALVDLGRNISTSSVSRGQHSLPGANNVARPFSSADVATVEHPPKLRRNSEQLLQNSTDSEPEPFALASDPLIPEKDLTRYSRDSNEFPPPPPSIEDASPTDKEDSPWVPLMSRFQVDASASLSECEEPLIPQRCPKPKSSSTDHRVPKFRSYTPKGKTTYVEVKNNEANLKSETCV